MSVNAYNSQTGTTTVLANGQRLWMGTQAAHDAAVSAGTIPNNCLVAITDDSISLTEKVFLVSNAVIAQLLSTEI